MSKLGLLLLATSLYASSSFGDDVFSFLPYFGPATGNTPIQIFSQNFKNGFDNSCVVFIGTTPCQDIRFVSAQEIDCNAAQGAVGTFPISVTCFDGRTAASTQSFTFYDALQLKADSSDGLAGTKVQLTATGGLPPYRFTTDSPKCASVDPVSGVATILAGCPTPSYGRFNFVVQDSINETTYAGFQIPTSLSADLSQLYLWVGQHFTLSVQGGRAPYQYQVISGPVTVTQDGVVTAGATGGLFTIRVTDSYGQSLDVSQRVVDHGYTLNDTVYRTDSKYGVNGPAGGVYRPALMKYFRNHTGRLIMASAIYPYTDNGGNIKGGDSHYVLVDLSGDTTLKPQPYVTSSDSDMFGAVLELSGGKIIVAGSSSHSGLLTGDSTRATLIRANEDLSLDSTFAGGRALITVQQKNAESIQSLFEEPSGNLLATLSSCSGDFDNVCQIYLVRISPDGKLLENVLVADTPLGATDAELARLPSGDVLIVVNAAQGAQISKIPAGAPLAQASLVALPLLTNLTAHYDVSLIRGSPSQLLLRVVPAWRSGNGQPGLISLVNGGDINPRFGDGKGIFVPVSVMPEVAQPGLLLIDDMFIQSAGIAGSEDKIVVLSGSSPGLVVRLNADGSRDSTFGTGTDVGYDRSFQWLVPSQNETQADVIEIQNGPFSYDASWFDVEKVQL